MVTSFYKIRKIVGKSNNSEYLLTAIKEQDI